MRSIAEFFRERAAREKQEEEKRGDLQQSWERMHSIVGSADLAEASFEKEDKKSLPPDLRDWRYYDWLCGPKIDVMIERNKKNGFMKIKVADKLNYFLLLLKGRDDINPTVLRGQIDSLPTPFLPDDPHKFAVNFTRVVRLHWESAPRLAPQPLR